MSESHRTAMVADPSIEALTVGLNAGDREAAERVFHQFAEQLVRLARTELSALIQPKMDPEDVVQSVLRTFFQRQKNGEWTIESWGSLWGFLSLITIRKCAYWKRHFGTQRR